ncbi:MAG: hypothetical protein AAB263_14175 [Planctomycetota bacterium]
MNLNAAVRKSGSPEVRTAPSRMKWAAVVTLLFAMSLSMGGCARIMQAVFAPQQTAAKAADAVADRLDSASTPGREQLNSMQSEVDRILAGKPRNAEELRRIQNEMNNLGRLHHRRGSFRDDPSRFYPWHPRAERAVRPFDMMDVTGFRGRQPAPRGLSQFGSSIDGIPRTEFPAPINMTPIRIRR